MGVRRIRGEMNIAPGKSLPVLFQGGAAIDRATAGIACARRSHDSRASTDREWLAADAQPPEAAMALVGDLKVLIPLQGLIDNDAELARLGREMARLGKELPRLEGKLADAAFLGKAPPQVVEKERLRLRRLQASL